ncbi:hypothetical protein RJ640_027629 [Escallonia rubra]|uniref:Uncharacterized protein n=1 Tax=Escallonia rubra TaxID=112253 RepID=A0AA88U2X3_9ASTE|nr:hypothetical protein RJ640_027629 [Escallonia rubra]
MALVSGGRSTLNPNAPLFIPAAVRQVEDFSPEWWQLVTTSTWFHDYWLSQHQGEDGFYANDDNDFDGDDIADLLPDTIDLDDDFSAMEAQFEQFIQSSESALKGMPENGVEVGAEALKKSLTLSKSMKGRGPKSPVETAKYREKPAKCVSPKYSPRCIQQPR